MRMSSGAPVLARAEYLKGFPRVTNALARNAYDLRMLAPLGRSPETSISGDIDLGGIALRDDTGYQFACAILPDGSLHARVQRERFFGVSFW
jgi:hypothetical protein